MVQDLFQFIIIKATEIKTKKLIRFRIKYHLIRCVFVEESRRKVFSSDQKNQQNIELQKGTYF